MNSRQSQLRNVRPWAVASWPKVEYYLPNERKQWPRFVEGGVALNSPQEQTLAAGSCVWVSNIADQAVGIAWDWCEVRRGVVCLLDPNRIITNLKFVQDDDHLASSAAACVAATRLVRSLRWQESVRSHLIAMADLPQQTRASDRCVLSTRDWMPVTPANARSCGQTLQRP